MAKRIIAKGVFQYDIFPYMVVQNIIRFEDDGTVVTDIGAYQGSALISSFGIKCKIEEEINKIKNDYETRQKELKKELLEVLFSSYPALKTSHTTK